MDNCRATQIEGLSDEFKNLEALSLINVGLTTLKGFPALPKLRKVSVHVVSECPTEPPSTKETAPKSPR